MPICSSGTQCPLYSAASLGYHVIGPHANPPSHIILTPGRPVMFRGPTLIVSTMQEETTPIFKRLWYDWTQQQPGIEPTNPLGQCWVPPIVAFYDQQGLLRTYSLPGGSIRSPHPGSPRGNVWGRGCHGKGMQQVPTRGIANWVEKWSFVILRED